jgi:uncharacterized membrane protein
MEHISMLAAFGALDRIALAVVLLAWLLIGWFIEHPPARHPSVSLLMQAYRREWMQQFLTRQPRIFDASMIDSLRQSTAFFASASMIAIGGAIAIIANPAAVRGVAEDLTLPTASFAIELRVLLVVGFLANALLKFIWSHRLFGYCSIMMAAVPNDHTDPTAAHRAAQAAELNITAAKSFNRGLRSIYFALGSLAWLLGGYALISAALLTAAVLFRREFASTSRQIMLERA